MTKRLAPQEVDLVGIGLYSAVDASRLLRIPTPTLRRWLRGHSSAGKGYEPLWRPQVDFGEDGFCLGFRDLQEARVAAAFIEKGLSPQRVRQAISMARDLLGEERPLSTTHFRSDGRSVFLQVIEESGETRLIDLFARQFAFKEILERSLTNLEYDSSGLPERWWPLGRAKNIVLDPARSFGQPIEAETCVPVATLVAAVEAEGSADSAARSWDVPLRAVKRALVFNEALAMPLAA